MVIQLLVRLMLLLWLRGASAARVTTTSVAKYGCSDTCGNVTIPFPFGIGADCAANQNFTISCNHSFNPPKPFFTTNKLEVLDISVRRGTVLVYYPVLASDCPNRTNDHPVLVNLSSPFNFSETYSLFMATGNCDYLASMNHGGKIIGGCLSFCNANANSNGGGYCQTRIPSSLNFINASFDRIDHNSKDHPKHCKYAFVVDRDWFYFNLTDRYDMQGMERVPAALDWATQGKCESFSNMSASANDNTRSVGQLCKAYYSFCGQSYYNTSMSSYGNRCYCNSGYEGNPYVSNGCQGISTGLIGILLLLGATWWLYKFVKRRKKLMLKQKFFKRNGGLLLQQQLSSGDEGNVEKTKLFTLKELEKATDRFNENQILGQGGQGTVYKGMLTDGRIVAVKRSKIVDEGNLGQFINEIVILSQINHRNVVKLHGCCLEAEVPLLVYEFIPNGTLYQYIHEQNEEFPLSWDIRVRVAIEVVGALSYLHSAASIPIYHQDIKSTNILLDEKFRAKVSDFGTSRSVSVDQTHMTTLVQGTVGYLDPEYFQSSQFTDKSDVYSFGVVLVELLTGKKPISSTISEGCRSLATYFILTMEENRLFDILDSRVSIENEKENIIRVANLAKRCLNLNGRKRPTMKEVAIELEGIRMSHGVSTIQQNYEVVEYALNELTGPWDAASTSVGSHLDSSASLDIEPLLFK